MVLRRRRPLVIPAAVSYLWAQGAYLILPSMRKQRHMANGEYLEHYIIIGRIVGNVYHKKINIPLTRYSTYFIIHTTQSWNISGYFLKLRLTKLKRYIQIPNTPGHPNNGFKEAVGAMGVLLVIGNGLPSGAPAWRRSQKSMRPKSNRRGTIINFPNARAL